MSIPTGISPSLRAPRQWFDIAYDGIDQLAQSTGSRWTITDAHGNADGIGVYVAERETETLFHVEATGTFTAAKVDAAAVSSMSMCLRDGAGREPAARDLAKNLRTVAASHRAMRALDNVLGALRLPAGVTRDLTAAPRPSDATTATHSSSTSTTSACT